MNATKSSRSALSVQFMPAWACIHVEKHILMRAHGKCTVMH